MAFVILLLLPLLCSPTWAQELQCNPCKAGFGHVTIGTHERVYVELTNVGNKFLRIKSKSKSGAAFSFGYFPLPKTLAPGASIKVPLRFKPTTSGWTSGTATLLSNNVYGPLTIKLAGTGVDGTQLKLTPTSLDFGSVNVGKSATLPLSLSASGGAVTISSADLTGKEITLHGLALPMTLASGQTIQIKLQFTPTAKGQISDKLILNSDANNSPTAEFLAGTGVAAGGHSVSLSWDAGKDQVIGYNVYRSSKSGGPYTIMNNTLLAATDYADYAVDGGATYFYAVTAVNAQGQESSYSNKVKAVIPYP